jgi:curved DNA-binding protein
MDYYSILGVPRTASEADLKKAYKKASMQHHPDRGGNAEKFKEVSEAYTTLKDPQKRQQYDNPQPQGFGRNDFGGMGGFEDVMRNAGFGHGFAQQQRQHTPRNRDIPIQADIHLSDVLTGKTLIIQYQLSNGSIETVNVDVPSGAKHGDTIQYEGLGDVGHPRYPRGNLHVKIRVIKNRSWQRDQDNLFTKKPINVFDLLLGCAIIVQTLDERKIRLVIPKGTQPGATFSITNYGIPDLHNKIRGNIYVTIETEIPQVDEIDLLTKIEELRDRTKN